MNENELQIIASLIVYLDQKRAENTTLSVYEILLYEAICRALEAQCLYLEKWFQKACKDAESKIDTGGIPYTGIRNKEH